MSAPIRSPAPARSPAPVRVHIKRPPPQHMKERQPGRRTLILFVLLLVGICLAGAPYYLAPIGERLRSPMHAWFRPAGYIGQSAGLLALAIFIFLWLYPLRKKFRWLSFTGTIAKWLNVHVLSALALPLLVAIHAAWRFRGLIGLGFWSMMVVWLSGIVGRYIYARIPRSKAGVELSREEILNQRQATIAEIARRSGLDAAVVERTLAAESNPVRGGILGTLTGMMHDDFARRRAARELRRLWNAKGHNRRESDRRMIKDVVSLARREMALAQQSRMLDATHAVFRYWHILHRPVAIAALIAVVVHVAVVVALHATWLW